MAFAVPLLVVAVFFGSGRCLEFRAKAYEDLVIAVEDTVPTHNCKAILSNLEVSFQFQRNL